MSALASTPETIYGVDGRRVTLAEATVEDLDVFTGDCASYIAAHTSAIAILERQRSAAAARKTALEV